MEKTEKQDRLTALESEVAELRQTVEQLRGRIDLIQKQSG